MRVSRAEINRFTWSVRPRYNTSSRRPAGLRQLHLKNTRAQRNGVNIISRDFCAVRFRRAPDTATRFYCWMKVSAEFRCAAAARSGSHNVVLGKVCKRRTRAGSIRDMRVRWRIWWGLAWMGLFNGHRLMWNVTAIVERSVDQWYLWGGVFIEFFFSGTKNSGRNQGKDVFTIPLGRKD